MKQTISDTRVVVTSLLVSLSDVTLNAIIGILTGSTVMFSQALQGLSDLVTALVIFIGVERSKRPADKHHPFGYGREIFFWVLIAGIFMFLGTGALSLYLGYDQIVRPEPITKLWLAFAMLSFGLISNGYSFWLSARRLRQSLPHPRRHLWQRITRSSLIETKATLLVDAMGTLAAVFGLFALGLYGITGHVLFDGVGSILVGLTMMLASILLMSDIRDLIVGRAVSDETAESIKRSAKRVPGVIDILDLRTLYFGSNRLFVVIEVHMDDHLNTDQIELISDRIKDIIIRDTPNVFRVQVEVETPDNENPSG